MNSAIQTTNPVRGERKMLITRNRAGKVIQTIDLDILPDVPASTVVVQRESFSTIFGRLPDEIHRLILGYSDWDNEIYFTKQIAKGLKHYFAILRDWDLYSTFKASWWTRVANEFEKKGYYNYTITTDRLQRYGVFRPKGLNTTAKKIQWIKDEIDLAFGNLARANHTTFNDMYSNRFDMLTRVDPDMGLHLKTTMLTDNISRCPLFLEDLRVILENVHY
jgi:hypothetical protein